MSPINRKKNISGRASDDQMQVHGEGRGEGPVGASDGYQARKDQQSGTHRASEMNGGRPISRPKTQGGQATGSMNTQGSGMGARPQQTRPTASGAPYGAQRPQASAQRPQQTAQKSSGGSFGAQQTSSGRKGFNPLILIILAVVLFGGGGSLSGLFGGGSDTTPTLTNPPATVTQAPAQQGGLLESVLGSDTGLTGLMSGYSSSALQSLLGGSWYSGQTGIGSTTSSSASSTVSYSGSGKLNRDVAAGSRDKYTQLLGNGRDQVTLMVYMCGADLESKSAMATKDLQEMLAANLGSNVRLIVYTGGATQWRNNSISSQYNQIWQVQNGQLKCLQQNAGTAAMTTPSTLSGFIRYCAENFPANRYGLILWNHGSGSVNGYGYDEKNPRAGSMSLAGLNTAFQDGGVKFDFIGFDTCLMATVENALMASKYADYLIASEETEPGIGWYYTDWLTALGQNPSIATLDLGKQICDDFVSHCNTQCRGQETTLSLIDLAELEHTVPAKLTSFSQSVSKLISDKEYKTVSNARNGSREFAVSSRIDQVDLTDLCNKLGTKEASALATTLTNAVKYNRTNNISNAYGLSVYFPYQRVNNVDKAANTYAAIGMDDSYAQAIRDFASVEISGQAVTGGTNSAMPSLFGFPANYGAASQSSSGDLISDLLTNFLGGGYSDFSGIDSSSLSFLTGRGVSDDDLNSTLTANLIDTSALTFQPAGDDWVLELPPEQWALVHGVDLNIFYDNGDGYVDLGLDNLFGFDDEGRLVADLSGTWIAIDGQPVPYYHERDEGTDEDYRITGRVPALLNGDRVELMIVTDPEGSYVSGARAVYDGETETVAKAIDEILPGDVIVFLADLYDYDQNYVDSYHFGNPVTVGDEGLTVTDVYLPDASKAIATYRITDIYNQAYWTTPVGR